MGTIPSPWLSDAAINLQIQEVNGLPSMLALTPDKERVHAWFGMLCILRADPAIKRALDDELAAYRHKPGWTPVVSWLTLLKLGIADAPQDYPFSLNEREFAMYATQHFGGRMEDVSGIYKPPNFYKALFHDVFALVAGGMAGAMLAASVPEWAAAGAAASMVAKAAPRAARSVGTMLGSWTAQDLLPGGTMSALRKDVLWRRYSLDLQRREL